jgi:hypothetical protein
MARSVRNRAWPCRWAAGAGRSIGHQPPRPLLGLAVGSAAAAAAGRALELAAVGAADGPPCYGRWRTGDGLGVACGHAEVVAGEGFAQRRSRGAPAEWRRRSGCPAARPGQGAFGLGPAGQRAAGLPAQRVGSGAPEPPWAPKLLATLRPTCGQAHAGRCCPPRQSTDGRGRQDRARSRPGISVRPEMAGSVASVGAYLRMGHRIPRAKF